jgi:hypothetical protein
MLRGTARGSAIWGATNGVVAGNGVDGSTVGDGIAVAVEVGTAAIAVGGEAVAVGGAVGKGAAASAADSNATRCTTIVLPSPSR